MGGYKDRGLNGPTPPTTHLAFAPRVLPVCLPETWSSNLLSPPPPQAWYLSQPVQVALLNPQIPSSPPPAP